MSIQNDVDNVLAKLQADNLTLHLASMEAKQDFAEAEELKNTYYHIANRLAD